MYQSRAFKRVEPPQPLVVVALLFVLGVAVGWGVDIPIVLAIGIGAVLMLIYLFTSRRWILYLLCVVGGVLCATAERDVGVEMEGEGVYSLEILSEKRALEESTRSVVYYGADSTLTLAPSDRLICYGRMRNFGSRHYIYISSRSIYEHTKADVPPLSQRLSGWVAGRLDMLGLSDEASALARAMFLAQRGGISEEVMKSYRSCGAVHLLAVSGLHLGIISLILNLLLLPLVLLHRGNVLWVVLLIALIWLYVYIVGAPISVVRAAIMLSALWLSTLSLRSYSSLNALAFAVIVMVAWSPAAIFDLGFQLSVISVGAILLWALPVWRRLRFGRWWWVGDYLILPTIIGVGCSIATMPIISHTFGYIPIFGALLNPLLLLTTMIILALTSLWVLFGLSPLAPLVGGLLELFIMAQNRVVEWGSEGWRGAVGVEIDGVSVGLIYLGYVVATWLLGSFSMARSRNKSL